MYWCIKKISGGTYSWIYWRTKNRYWRFLPADIKYYLRRITEISIKQSFQACDAAFSVTVNFTNFAFWINCNFNVGILFYSIVILLCDPCVFSIKVQLSRSNARARYLKQQARAMEHVSVKPNERRKKLSLLQMQRGEVIKCRQI